mgnify:CR=1 FL=1
MSDKRPFLEQTQPEIYKALIAANEEAVKASEAAGVSEKLTELAKVRSSQLNGCQMCLSMHVPAARKAGVTQLQLDILPAWTESDEFTEEEKATLRLADALTLLDSSAEVDDAIEEAREVFSADQLAAIEWHIAIINAFNRFSIASNHPPQKKNYS